jgi:hypothetical protein
MCTLPGRCALLLLARLLQSPMRKCRIKACLIMKIAAGPVVKVHLGSVLKETILQISGNKGIRNCWCDA